MAKARRKRSTSTSPSPAKPARDLGPHKFFAPDDAAKLALPREQVAALRRLAAETEEAKQQAAKLVEARKVLDRLAAQATRPSAKRTDTRKAKRGRWRQKVEPVVKERLDHLTAMVETLVKANDKPDDITTPPVGPPQATTTLDDPVPRPAATAEKLSPKVRLAADAVLALKREGCKWGSREALRRKIFVRVGESVSTRTLDTALHHLRARRLIDD
jgi:hypothetical protein